VRETGDEPKENCIPYQLQKLFIRMQTTDSKAVDTADLRKSFGWTSDDAVVQQDCEEFISKLLDSLEVAFKETNVDGVVPALFGGTKKGFVRCCRCGYESGNEIKEVPSIVRVVVKEFGGEPAESLEDALAKGFGDGNIERLEGDNQYKCERCANTAPSEEVQIDKNGVRTVKVDADKGNEIKKAAYIQAVSITRADYDWETDQQVKVHDSMSFPFTLDMAPYVSQEILEPEALEATGSQAAAHTNFGMDGAETLQRGISARADLDRQDYPYDLFAVMIHSGSTPSSGHYYGYMKQFHDAQWYKFNDELVTGPFTEEEVAEASFGGVKINKLGYKSSQTAYMLFYRRVAPDTNIVRVPSDDIPEALIAEIEADERAKEAKTQFEAAEKERKADTVKFFAFYKERCGCIYAKEKATWEDVQHQVALQLDVDVQVKLAQTVKAPCILTPTTQWLHGL
jgi:ubiquitin C-terminal hydrolase